MPYGATLPKGILFYGEPGNGKTMFANAIAKDSGAKTFYLSDNLYMQENRSIANELVKLFKQAKENSPSIIILDEIDSLIECHLGFGQSPSDSEKETLRVLLTEIDKVQDAGVLVVATGNVDVEELPSALVRNGRIEKHVYIGDPDFKEDNMLAKEYFVYNDATLILAGPKRAVSYEWIFYDIKNKSKKVNVIPYGNSSLTSQKLVLYIPTSQLEEKTYKVTLTVKDIEGNDYTDSCGLVIYNNFTY